MDRLGSQAPRRRARRPVCEILRSLLAFGLLGTAAMRGFAQASEAPSNSPMIAAFLDVNAGPLWQFAQVRPGGNPCDPDPKKNDTISAALIKRAKGVYASCATPSRPARFKIGNGSNDLAVIVRPTSGDLDAFLMTGGEIVDASLNAKQRPEVLLTPAPMRDLEVVVVASMPAAVFEISLITVPPASSAPARQTTDAQDEQSGRPWIAFALGSLGYDLLGPAGGDQDSGILNRRAIMAFQVAEKFPVTGKLLEDQLTRLYQNAAQQIDAEAIDTVSLARRITGQSRQVEFSDTSGGLRSIKSGIYNGRVFGVGEFLFGGSFEGEWLDGAEVGSSQRPLLGFLWLPNNCSISLRNMDGVYATALAGLLEKSLGVRRQNNNRITFSGKLAQLVARNPDEADVGPSTVCTPTR
jgi:hypothetical protein